MHTPAEGFALHGVAEKLLVLCVKHIIEGDKYDGVFHNGAEELNTGDEYSIEFCYFIVGFI